MRSVAVVVLLSACGRLGFDDVATRAGDAGRDAPDAPPAVLRQLDVTASNADPYDHFGYGLAVSGDGTTIVVGAPDEASNGTPSDNSLTSAGAAYVLARMPTGWTQQAYLKPSSVVANMAFGQAAALSADGNTLAIAAPLAASAAGAVYVFTRSGTSWTQAAELHPAVVDADWFGYSLALDAAGDTLVVGAIHEDSIATGINGNANDNSASDSGAAYVFAHGVAWTQQAYLKASNTDAGDHFGWAVACSADGNTVAIGAPSEASGQATNQADNSQTNAGAVYVFTRAGTTWSQQSYVKEPTPGGGNFFGYSVALDGTGAQLEIGSPGEDSVIANSGAAYVFSGAAVTQLKAPNAGDGDQLGVSVAIADDGTPFAGAILEDSGSMTDPADNSELDSGAVYRFGASPAYIKRQFPKASDSFGEPLAISADGATIAASATFADSAGTDAGSITILYFGQ